MESIQKGVVRKVKLTWVNTGGRTAGTIKNFWVCKRQPLPGGGWWVGGKNCFTKDARFKEGHRNFHTTRAEQGEPLVSKEKTSQIKKKGGGGNLGSKKVQTQNGGGGDCRVGGARVWTEALPKKSLNWRPGLITAKKKARGFKGKKKVWSDAGGNTCKAKGHSGGGGKGRGKSIQKENQQKKKRD